MTFPAYRSLLQGVGGLDADGSRPVALGAAVDDNPAGLVLGRIPALQPLSLEILSLYVVPEHRGEDVATQLLEELEDMARVRYSVMELSGVYLTGKPAVPALERVFEKRGFGPSVLRGLVLRFEPEDADQCRWYRRARLPRGASLFPWRDLTPADRDALQQSQRERDWVDAALDQSLCDADCDPISSMGMRVGGEIVGWAINHRVAPDFVRFTASFVRRDLAARGAMFPLYAASIDALRGTGVTCSTVIPARFDRLIEFAQRRCAPFARFCGESRIVTKNLFAHSAFEFESTAR